MERSVQEVAQAHLDAVRAGDVVAMAADYAVDAVLLRDADSYVGQPAIAAYFATVPDRLGDATVVFDSLTVDEEHAAAIFHWHLEGSPIPVSGTDICRIVHGAIVHQVVELASTDF